MSAHSVIRSIYRRLAGESGFTLSEMLVVIAILGLILGAFSLIFSTTLRHSGEIQEQNVMQTEVRAVTERIAREVRQAYVGDGTSPIETSTATQVQFLSLDGAQPYHLRRIAYRLNAGKLERSMAVSTNTAGPPWTIPALGAWGTVLDSIKSTSLFTYYDSASPTPGVTTTPADVRMVAITIKYATDTQPGRQYTYATTATMRIAR